MTIVLDTNLIVSALTDRDPDQQQVAERLIRESSLGNHELVVPFFVLLEIRYVLSNVYGLGDDQISMMIRAFVALPAVAVCTEVSVSRWLELWPEVFSDPPDAALAAVAEENGWAVGTFDREFQRALVSIEVAVWHP